MLGVYITMGSRLKLHEEFKQLIGNDNVYFQPPTNTSMNNVIKYPCIIYQQRRPDIKRADNNAYGYTKSYDVTVISKSPTYDLPERIVKHFMMCTEDRFYTADNLNHWALTLYY